MLVSNLSMKGIKTATIVRCLTAFTITATAIQTAGAMRTEGTLGGGRAPRRRGKP
jgi:hypothetical protein